MMNAAGHQQCVQLGCQGRAHYGDPGSGGQQAFDLPLGDRSSAHDEAPPAIELKEHRIEAHRGGRYYCRPEKTIIRFSQVPEGLPVPDSLAQPSKYLILLNSKTGKSLAETFAPRAVRHVEARGQT